MAKADPPKKRKPKVGAAVGVGASSGALYGAKQFAKGFVPYNVETSFKPVQKVPRKIKGVEGHYYTDVAERRQSIKKSYAKRGVKTVSTITTSYMGPYGYERVGARGTTLSGRGKLSKLGQIVIQERKVPEPVGRLRVDKKGSTKGRIATQGGKGTGAGRYVIDTITYAKEGYPTPKKGRIPKGGRAAVSVLNRETKLTGKILDMYAYRDVSGDVRRGLTLETKTKKVYKDVVSAGSKTGMLIKSKTAKDVLSTATKVAKGASKLVGAANVVGAGFLAYDTGRAIQEYAGTPHQKKQMKKYKEQGGFSATGGY